MTHADPTAELPERERNWRLRRADWRFLLSTPRPASLVCFADKDLRVACEAIAPPNASHAHGDRADRDLAVVQNADASGLGRAWATLRAGGELYGEWHHASADQVRALLTDVGFADVRCYWPWPSPPRAEVWVPLDAPWAFDYYVHVDRHVYSGLRHRVGTRARRLIARRRLTSGRPSPLCVVARKPHDAPDEPHREPAIISRLRVDGIVAPTEPVTCALLTGGPRALSKVVGLVYTPNDQSPACVVKWPRVGVAEVGLANEASVLTACHRDHPAAGVPQVLATTGSGATLAVAETIAPGAPMFTTLDAGNYESLTASGAEWLTTFHDSPHGGVATADVVRARAHSALARFADTFGDVIERSLLDDTARLLEPLRDMPVVIEHRDYGPWNIFMDNAGQLSVLDWESSRIEGLPLLDLLYFITYTAFFLDGAMVSRDFVTAYRRSLDPHTMTGAVRHALMTRYADRFGIMPDAQRALRALCWMEHAESEYQAYCADAGGAPSSDVLRGSVFARLWAEEIAHLRR